MQLKDLFAPFLADCSRNGRTAHTVYNHKLRLEKIVGPSIGDLEVGNIRMSDVGWVIELARKYGNGRENGAVITLRRLLRFAQNSGIKLALDWRDIEVPPYRVKSDVQALTQDEIVYIRKVMSEDELEYSKHTCEKLREKNRYALARTRCLFEFLLHTGLRISEALAINFEDLDFEKSELRVENCKTGTWDTVYLYGCTQAISDYLSIRKDGHNALFATHDGRRLTSNGAKSTLRRLKSRVKLKKSLTHKLFRSTFVTMLFRAKCDPKQAQYLARHRSLQTTLDYYYRVQKEDLKPIHRAVMSEV